MNNLVIIGSGPAGLTAAIYSARAGLSPLVIEGFIKGGQAGGQLMTTTDIENFPGFPNGINGAELIMNMRSQAERFNTKFLMEDVEKIEIKAKGPFKIQTTSQTIESKALIIATGSVAKYLEIPSIEKFKNKGVSACATCDGALPMYRNKVLAVIGGGDTAIEEATFLTRFASKVLLIHRRNEFRASKAMQDKISENKKIEPIMESVLEEVLGSDFVEKIKVKNVTTGQLKEYECSGVFMAIGHKPNTDFLEGALELNELGYIKVKSPSSLTSVEGVFACGDVADPTYRQAIRAAGTGCVAALDAEHWLRENI